LDLIPRPDLAVSDLLKERLIVRSDFDRTRFSATHGPSSLLKEDLTSSIAAALEFRALLMARDTSAAKSPPPIPRDPSGRRKCRVRILGLRRAAGGSSPNPTTQRKRNLKDVPFLASCVVAQHFRSPKSPHDGPEALLGVLGAADAADDGRARSPVHPQPADIWGHGQSDRIRQYPEYH